METTSVWDKIKNKFSQMSLENKFLVGILVVTLGMIAGLTVGIVLSQNGRDSMDPHARAIDLLEKYPLIDG